MTTPLEKSFKNRLQLVARERNITPAEVWQNLVTERFLARLCKSPYCSNFILKGGTLLARHVDIGRETRDLDFSVDNLENNINTISQAIEAIISVDLEDGFEFKNVKAESLDHLHTKYPGALIRLDACFGKTRLTLFIDLDFGDHLKAKEENFLLLANSKGPIFESAVSLKCYPMEFVFAEKLETVIYRGAENSRMKDFHDLLSMVNNKEVLSGQEAGKAIQAVFKHRRTTMSLPLKFEEPALLMLQHSWQRYRQTLVKPDSLPKEFIEVIEVINAWLKTHAIPASVSGSIPAMF